MTPRSESTLPPAAVEAVRAACVAYGKKHHADLGLDVQPTPDAVSMAIAVVEAAAPSVQEPLLRTLEGRLREKAEVDSAARPGFRRGLIAAADILAHCAAELAPAPAPAAEAPDPDCSCPEDWVTFSEVGPHPSPECRVHGGGPS